MRLFQNMHLKTCRYDVKKLLKIESEVGMAVLNTIKQE